MTEERAPYVDVKLPRRLVPLVRQSLRLVLAPEEEVFGIFAVSRFRRSICVLVVTDSRLLTLGDEHVGLPLVDEVPRSAVGEVTVERVKVWTAGLVTARMLHGEEVNLGTLSSVNSATFLRLDEVLARPTGSSLMPTIPTPGLELALERGELSDLDDGPTAVGDASAAHPLVAHLTALADLHDRGALSAAEFTAAKARLLADPSSSTSG